MIRIIFAVVFTVAQLAVSRAAEVCCDDDIGSHAIVIDNSNHSFGNHYNNLGDYSLDVDDDIVILRPHSGRIHKIKITGDYSVYADGWECDLDDEGKQLAKDIHNLAIDIQCQAIEIGKEGAKVGVAGARLGIEAVAGVIKLISPTYDSDDLEREMEYKSEKLEAIAEKLEAKAEILEEKAEDLEDLADDLTEKIRDLDHEDRY